jgi:DNA polymerase-3 subunit epsilon
MARELEASPNYRVLRRLTPEALRFYPCAQPTKTAIYLDSETTGFDHKSDEVIELAMIKFKYADSRIVGLGETFQAYREPKQPIPEKITALTGIDAEKVAGQSINAAEVGLFIADAALIVAHSAAFDRPFVEGLCEGFALKPWACSQSQVDWAMAGHEGTKLGYLAADMGWFYDKHRAEADCLAGIAILAQKDHFAELRKKAVLPTWRVWAEGAPFNTKDVLKARGYSWNGGEDGRPKAWYADVENVQGEIEWLRKEIYGRSVTLRAQKITAFERFSARPLPFDGGKF